MLSPTREWVHELDDFDLESFLGVAREFGGEKFAYAVTPNTDHLLRHRDDLSFRSYYRDARFILLDSRFVALILRITHGLRLRVCTGSDLTAALFERVILPQDRIVVVGGSPEIVARIAARYGLEDLRHLNPPMGFLRDPQAFEQCLEFVEAQSPFRYCFVAVGAPQQEAVANQLLLRGRARGLALCVGAALNFIGGAEKRAPKWMQRLALEWLYRLAGNPRRLAYRYLIRGPRIFTHLLRARIVVRGTPNP
jgi:exopolysaccharide biosynthesis WecB/TagA/CpsF family protein